MSTADTKQTEETVIARNGLSGPLGAEYTLTVDELGMIQAAAAAHQQAFEAERNTLLGSVIRYRKLGDGNWRFEDGKLKR